MFVAPGSFFNSRARQLAILRGAPHASGDLSSPRLVTEVGGLVDYGTEQSSTPFVRSESIPRVFLKGAKPADLPVHAVDQI